MKHIQFGQDAITQDNLNYSLSGKVEPRFVNLGKGDVKIAGVLLSPRESFNAGFCAGVTEGSLAIEFVDESQINRVDCFYGTEIADPNVC